MLCFPVTIGIMKDLPLKKSFNFCRNLLLVFVLIFIFIPFSFAQTDRKIEAGNRFVFDSLPLNLEEITNSADRIFTGVCEKIEEIEKDPVSNLTVIKYTFKITESVKGINSDEITFNQWKPTTVDAGYVIGEKYVVFLYPNSRIGLTSPVGFMQGKFLVEKKGENRGVEFVRNKINNTGLSKNLRTQKRISIKDDYQLNNYIHECSQAGKPIRYKDFIKAVRYLSNQ